MPNQFHLQLKALRQAVVEIPQATVDAASKRLAGQQGVVSDAIKLIHTAATEVDELKTEIGATTTDVAALKTQVGATVTDMAAVQTQLGATVTDVAAVKTQLGATVTDVAAVKTQVGATVADVAAVKAQVGATATTVVALQDQLTTAEAELAQLTKRFPAGSDVAALIGRVAANEAALEGLGARLAKTDLRLECLSGLCEVAEILSRWQGDTGQDHTAELAAIEHKYRSSFSAVAPSHVDDWRKLCEQLAKSATPDKRAHRGQMLRTLAHRVVALGD